jgi:hypothetical protein
MKRIAVLILLGLLSPIPGYSQSQAPLGLSIQDLLSAEEQALTEKARNRTYPGGLDEEPIQIQQAVKPTATEDEADSDGPARANEEAD